MSSEGTFDSCRIGVEACQLKRETDPYPLQLHRRHRGLLKVDPRQVKMRTAKKKAAKNVTPEEGGSPLGDTHAVQTRSNRAFVGEPEYQPCSELLEILHAPRIATASQDRQAETLSLKRARFVPFPRTIRNAFSASTSKATRLIRWAWLES